MLAALTGMGLSAAAGLNAYIPILIVGLLSNFTDAVHLPKDFAWLGNGWVLGVVGVLLAAEFVLDKVPVVDSVNDTIQTAIRPASGGIVFSATQAASEIDNSTWMSEHPWVGWLLGIVIALIVHVMKSTARPVINATTVGAGGPVVSAVEDAGSVGLSFVAIFLPILVIAFLIALAFMAVWTFRKVRAFRARNRRRPVPG
ncbi:Probable transmembrane protein [Alloactinosynnema sp. L-07]|uniref:DUF4126 domain-containing protein n=1 Tax=Alloactinosynnema sp. L-07 TaxID=1653480 RepID=UPI00065F00E1|nr:DUF4126 domain-containing protein [Alloactinosynnema sp. L-07]CRK56154.1 Probable transmembrane protein [Alloactinosynnema sp. L-07]